MHATIIWSRRDFFAPATFLYHKTFKAKACFGYIHHSTINSGFRNIVFCAQTEALARRPGGKTQALFRRKLARIGRGEGTKFTTNGTVADGHPLRLIDQNLNEKYPS
jgi:hypothetical protein